MIELPESAVLAAQINQQLAGQRIAAVQAAASPHKFAFFYQEDPAAYPALLEGKLLERAEAWSGHLELILGTARLNFNDGARLRYLPPGQAPPAKHQLLLRFGDDSHLLCTVQMYAGIMAFPVGEHDNFYYQVAREKPSPLTAAFDEAYFQSLWRAAKPKLSAKAFLATEQRIPGLGNGVAQDILFLAGIHPKRKLETIGAAEQAALYHSVKDTLRQMHEQGGRDTERDLFGEPGGYHTLLSSKTVAEPCPQCGSAIIRQAYLGGNIYFCPHCQPLTV